MAEWSDSYSIGINEIDAQHKTLLECLSRLKKWHAEGYGTAAVLDAFNQLSDYARIHFAVEESLMRILGYPDYEAHHEEHDRLTEELRQLERKMMSSDVTDEVIVFLEKWVVEHIMQSDRKYAQHFLTAHVVPDSPVPSKGIWG